ncbi:hypothetical protein J132_09662 [Termitomyces sp. J132]|nr:hypothetical protein J132_09662 [Termitomyces sp. J132]
MADAHSLFDVPPHPFTRYMKRDFSGKASPVASPTSKPIKYYLVDFDLSKEYPSGVPGGDRSVPEHLLPDAPPCNPFPVDVYCLGNVVREHFLDGCNFAKAKKGFDFMRELIGDMTNPDPQNRPQMSEANSRLKAIVGGLSDWKLRSPIVEIGQRVKVTKLVRHWTIQLIRKVRGVPAIPKL